MATLRKVNYTSLDMDTFSTELPRPTPVNEDSLTKQHVHMFPPTDGSVDLCGEIIAVDAKGDVAERHKVGAVYTLTGRVKEVAWPNCRSVLKTEVQLAPAFAGLANAWLDRSMVTTLASALAWSGISRSSELDPQARTALRVAATMPIELTRFYVRAYALLLSSAHARSSGVEYRPRLLGAMRHVNAEADNMIAWSSALTTAALSGGATLFFDTHTLSHVDDLYNVLVLITAPRLVNAGLADWFWPTIPGAILCTNQTRLPHLAEIVPYEQIEQAISWLISSTNTAQQAREAMLLVQQMGMRPDQAGLFGSRLISRTVSIALPRAQTAGQMLVPFSLWASTSEFEPLINTMSGDHEQMLSSAACHSAAFTYSIQLAASQIATPRWWLAKHARQYARREASASLIRDGHWFVAMAAHKIRKLIAVQQGSIWSTGIWPHGRACVDKLARGLHIDPHAIQLLTTKCLSTDAANARYLKSSIDSPMDETTIGAPMLIKHVLQNVASPAAAASLVMAGARVGYADINQAMQVVSSICWAQGATSLTGHLFPETGRSATELRHLIHFPTVDSYLQTKRILGKRCESSWYIHHVSYQHINILESLATQVRPTGQTQPQSSNQERQLAPEKVRDDTSEASDESTPSTTSQSGKTHSHGAHTPQPIVQVAKTDELIAAVLEAARKPEGPWLKPSARVLEDWAIPQTIVNDNDALRWLHENVRTHFASTQIVDATGSLGQVSHTLSEQIKVNTARVWAEEADLPIPKKIDDTTLKEAEKALLGKEVGATEAAAAAPQQAAATQQVPAAGSSTSHCYAGSAGTLSELRVTTTQ
jgi:hypothetical protein